MQPELTWGLEGNASTLLGNYAVYIQTLVSKGGPDLTDYAWLNTWTRNVHALVQRRVFTEEHIKRLREEFKDAFSPATMQGFALLKPHGYAGDFEIIDRLYNYYISDRPSLAKWDHYAQQQPGAKAVRNRKAYFIRLLERHTAAVAPRRLEVLKVAVGPGRSMHDFFRKNPDANIHIDCLDIDPKALEYAKDLNKDFLPKITLIHGNALRFKPDRQYDLVWSAGLFDYFGDKLFRLALKKLLQAAKPGGEIVIGNFADTNPSIPYQEFFNDWFLNHRSREQLLKLAMECGVSAEKISIGQEEEGVNLFLHIAKM